MYSVYEKKASDLKFKLLFMLQKQIKNRKQFHEISNLALSVGLFLTFRASRRAPLESQWISGRA